MEHASRSPNLVQLKCRYISYIFPGISVVLFCYIAWLQLFKSDKLAEQARTQQDYIVYIPGKRGALLDRNGIPLNTSIPAYHLGLRIESIREPRDNYRRTLDKISAAVSEIGAALGPEFYNSRPSREEALRHIRHNTPLPFILWRNLDRKTMDSLAVRKFPGTELVMSWKRHYEFPDSAALLRGRTGFGTPDYMPELKNIRLNTREMRGIDGIEKAVDSIICGDGGYEQLKTDVLSYRSKVEDSRKAVPGQDIQLTIDIALQASIENDFRRNNYTGALVLLDLRTSQVLASVSEPSAPLPPLQPGAGINSDMVNRVLAGYYPPGSTLKPLIAWAALAENRVTAEEYITCNGAYSLPGGRSLGCTGVHGAVNLETALAKSCNVYFCVLGERLGKQGLNLMGESLPLGEKLMTELQGQEIRGIRFTPEWMEIERNKKTWTAGDTANASIGQGAWAVTPMQLLVSVTAAVTGKLHHPVFLKRDYDPVQESLPLSPAHRDAIKAGMEQCVISGTGRNLQIDGIRVIAKTGTAETGAGKSSHALVYAALPADNPRIAGVCVIEHGGGGGRVAAPILRSALIKAVNSGY